MTTLAPPMTSSHGSDAEPLVAVACPACHAALAAARESAGTAVRCPLCHAAFTVPVPPRRRPPPESQAQADRPDEDPLRSLRERRSIRRARRNIVMLVSGVVILLAITILFGTQRRKKRR